MIEKLDPGTLLATTPATGTVGVVVIVPVPSVERTEDELLARVGKTIKEATPFAWTCVVVVSLVHSF